MKRESGFTLVELMISLAIFALLVTLAYGSVNLLMDANRRVQEPQADFQQLQWAMALVERDLHQMVLRKRNTGYSEQEAALVVPEDTGLGVLLTFTRGGNPDMAWQLRDGSGQMRSTLQRVNYALENKTLVRHSWDLVDYVDNTEPVTTTLLTQIEAIKLRFLATKGGEFQTTWSETEKLPVAIEIIIKHERFGELRRIFLVCLS